MPIEVIIDRTDQLVRAVRNMTGRQVLVGIPSTTAGRREGPITNASLGYIHEFGSPAQNIPARPFLGPGIQEASRQITERMQNIGQNAFRLSEDDITRRLMAVGMLAQSAVRKKITDGPFAPLAPSTLAKRRARGATRTKPLIDTGQLRTSITFVIRDRNGRS